MKMRIRRKCVLCGEVINNMSQHVTRKHAGMSTLERKEYREKMLTETPIQWIAKDTQNKKKRTLLKCPLCCALGIRMDSHLVAIHSIRRGSRQLKTLLAKAKEQSQHLSYRRERSQQQQQQRSRVEVTEPEQLEIRGRVDSNLKFMDESDAYAAYCSKVSFTPIPKAGSRVDSLSTYELHPVSGAGETLDDPPSVQRTMKQSGATSAPGMSQSTFLDSLLDVVDRYWNGSKSLHAHSEFQAQAQSLLQQLLTDHSATSQEHIDRLQLDVARHAQENVLLHNKLGQQATAAAGSELQRLLDISQRDVDQLCLLELQEVTEETEGNIQQLQVQLQDARRKAADAASHGEVKESGQHGQEKLQQENERLKIQLKLVPQLQELATMLQESHKSLVTTNDHLLKELDETKQRHMEEVKQLHWSYHQLKQTMDITMPPTYAPSQSTTTTSSHQPQGGAVNGYDRGEENPTTQPGYGSYSHEFEKYLKRSKCRTALPSCMR